jgi:hypothetical protein
MEFKVSTIKLWDVADGTVQNRISPVTWSFIIFFANKNLAYPSPSCSTLESLIIGGICGTHQSK